MSTLPSNHQGERLKASQVNMAAATTTTITTTTKAKASKAGANANPKQKTQMHRRSRTGLSHSHELVARYGKLTSVMVKDATHAG
jgi:post-segregation antitoxin (ccd killing protein)